MKAKWFLVEQGIYNPRQSDWDYRAWLACASMCEAEREARKLPVARIVSCEVVAEFGGASTQA